MNKTRYKELAYEDQGPQVWRFIDTSTNRAVGPIYATRAELLADLPRYANQFGCEAASADLVGLLKLAATRMEQAEIKLQYSNDNACKMLADFIRCDLLTIRAALDRVQ